MNLKEAKPGRSNLGAKLYDWAISEFSAKTESEAWDSWLSCFKGGKTAFLESDESDPKIEWFQTVLQSSTYVVTDV